MEVSCQFNVCSACGILAMPWSLFRDIQIIFLRAFSFHQKLRATFFVSRPDHPRQMFAVGARAFIGRATFSRIQRPIYRFGDRTGHSSYFHSHSTFAKVTLARRGRASTQTLFIPTTTTSPQSICQPPSQQRVSSRAVALAASDPSRGTLKLLPLAALRSRHRSSMVQHLSTLAKPP